MRQNRHDDALDVSASPELLRLAEAVRASGRPRALRYGSETLAVIVPFPTTGTRRPAKRDLTPQDTEAFLTAAGSWSDVDVERFLADTYTARDVPDENPTCG
jgi:hypothetical protein